MASSKGPQPEQFAKGGSEHGNQVALFCKAAQNFERWPELRLMFAIPNGGMRDVRVAANLKAEGVKAGVPDIFLPVARGKWHGLFVELKRAKAESLKEGKATTEQIEWMNNLREQGYGAIIVVGWQAAWDAIEAYLTWQQ